MILTPKQYQILRFIDSTERPVTQIECHREVARYADETPTNTYNTLRRMKVRNLVTIRRNISGSPQSTSVRITDTGRAALEAEVAKIGGTQ